MNKKQVFLILGAVGLPLYVLADAPTVVPVQGYLEQSDGNPIDGVVAMTLSLYENDGDTAAISAETQNIEVHNGFFTFHFSQASLQVFRDNNTLYLGVAIDGELEMEPRIEIGTSPYAGFAQYSGDAQSLGGVQASDYRQSAVKVPWEQIDGLPSGLDDGDDDTLAGLQQACGVDQVPQWSGDQWRCIDLVEDGLAGLSCQDGDVAYLNVDTWECLFGVATEQWVDNQSYASQSWVTSRGFATQAQIPTSIDGLAGGSVGDTIVAPGFVCSTANCIEGADIDEDSLATVPTATALAADGTNCSTDSYPLGMDANGNSQSCTPLPDASSTNELQGLSDVLQQDPNSGPDQDIKISDGYLCAVDEGSCGGSDDGYIYADNFQCNQPPCIANENIHPSARGYITVAKDDSRADVNCAESGTQFLGVAVSWTAGGDDADCIQAALSAATELSIDKVRLLPGTFLMESTIFMVPNVQLVGHDQKSSRVQMVAGPNLPYHPAGSISPILNWNGANNASVSGIHFSSDGIPAHFIMFPGALQLSSKTYAHIFDNIFTGDTHDGSFVYINKGNHDSDHEVTIENNTFTGAGSGGVLIFYGCYNSGQGVVNIRGNTFAASGQKSAIIIDENDCAEVEVAANQFSLSGARVGLRVYSVAPNVTVFRNMFKCASTSSDWDIRGSGFVVSGNTIYNCEIHLGDAAENCANNAYLGGTDPGGCS